MLLYENFTLLLHINRGLRQTSFSFARRYLHNGELTARLQNQLWFISMCVRRRALPPTVKNLHLPACIGESSARILRFQILKKMKRGLRSSLEAAKRKTRQLNANLEGLPVEDREMLRSGSTQAFNITYNSASEHFRDKLRRVCEHEGRPEAPTEDLAISRTTHTDRVTDITLELTTVEKKLLSKGPKFALSAAVDERTQETCQTSFARFAYQYRWGVTRDEGGEHTNRSRDSSRGLPIFPRSSDISLPPTDADTEGRLRRLYHALMTIVRSQQPRPSYTNLPRAEVRALRGLRNKPVALMPSDKGGEFCAVDLETYKELGRSHLAYHDVPTGPAHDSQDDRGEDQPGVEDDLPEQSDTHKMREELHLEQHKPGDLPSRHQDAQAGPRVEDPADRCEQEQPYGKDLVATQGHPQPPARQSAHAPAGF
jgi:hypothetical protein